MADENIQSNGTPEAAVELGAAVVPDVEPAAAVEVKQAELPLEPAPEVKPGVKEPEPVVPEWAKKEINKKHARNKELERKLAERDTELESLRVIAARVQNPEAEPRSPAYVPPQDNRAAVEAEAARLVAEREYNTSVNSLSDNGKKAYGAEWDRAIENLVTLGGDGSFTTDVMQGILATDNPEHVLLELGKSPETYQRIMELQPAKRQTELVKLSMQPAGKKISAAPAPVEPVGGRAAPTGLRDDMSDDDWNAARDEIERRRWEQKRGGRRA